MSVMLCKHCGKPIKSRETWIECMKWTHMDGMYGCNAARPCHSITYATPAAPTETGEAS